jgi:hypothetical protein
MMGSKRRGTSTEKTRTIIKEEKMGDMESITQMLPYLAPIIILNLVLLVISLVDITRREHVAGGSKIIWVLVAVLFQIIGPIIYLIVGRKEAPVEGD